MRGFLGFVYQLRLLRFKEERRRNNEMRDARKYFKKLAKNINVTVTDVVSNELNERVVLPTVVRISNWTEDIDYPETEEVFVTVDCPIGTPLIVTLQLLAVTEFHKFGFQTSFGNTVTARQSPTHPGVECTVGSHAAIAHYKEIRTVVARRYEHLLIGSGRHLVLPKNKTSDFLINLPYSKDDMYNNFAAEES